VRPQKSLSLFSPLSLQINAIPETNFKPNHSRSLKSFENFNFSDANNFNYSKTPKENNNTYSQKKLFYENINNNFNHKNEIRPDLYRVKKLEEMNLECFMQEDYFFVCESEKFKIILINVTFSIILIK
jgi:hypothetical protein